MCWKSLLAAIALGTGSGLAADPNPQPVERRVTLADCVRQALERNRELQVQQFNPRIAQLTLDNSYSYYDPVLTAGGRHQHVSDRGGYDPNDLSKDAVYDADSETADLAIEGYLPTGMRYTLVGEYADSYGVRNFIDFDSYNLSAGVSVQQPLLRNFWIDQGRYTIQVNRHNLKITELGVQYLAMDIVHRVQVAYAELVFAREHLKVEEKLLEVRQRFEAETRERIRVGSLPSLEEKLAQSQAAQVQATLVTARNAVALAENQLRLVIGDDFQARPRTRLVPAETLLVVPEPLALEASWERGLSQRPDLAQIRLDIERADLGVKYRRNQLFPSLDVVAGYGRRGASTYRADSPFASPASAGDAFEQIADGVAPNDLIGVLFSMPLTRRAERTSYRVSKELREQARALLKQREEEVLREISDALQSAAAGLDRVEATRVAAEAAAAAVEAERQKLAAGRSTFYVVLQLQGDQATAESAAYRAKADYHQALARLHFAEGSILDRHGLSLEWK